MVNQYQIDDINDKLSDLKIIVRRLETRIESLETRLDSYDCGDD